MGQLRLGCRSRANCRRFVDRRPIERRHGRSKNCSTQSTIAPTPTAAKTDLLEPYRGLLAAGDAEKGRFLFHSNREIRCNACHTVGNLGGGFVGPDLTEVGKRANREYLLESLIDPSAKIVKGFETLVIVTDDGKIFSGTFVADDGRTLGDRTPRGGKGRDRGRQDRRADSVAGLEHASHGQDVYAAANCRSGGLSGIAQAGTSGQVN